MYINKTKLTLWLGFQIYFLIFRLGIFFFNYYLVLHMSVVLLKWVLLEILLWVLLWKCQHCYIVKSCIVKFNSWMWEISVKDRLIKTKSSLETVLILYHQQMTQLLHYWKIIQRCGKIMVQWYWAANNRHLMTFRYQSCGSR